MTKKYKVAQTNVMIENPGCMHLQGTAQSLQARDIAESL
jgi:hypothetical protein